MYDTVLHVCICLMYDTVLQVYLWARICRRALWTRCRWMSVSAVSKQRHLWRSI